MISDLEGQADRVHRIAITVKWMHSIKTFNDKKYHPQTQYSLIEWKIQFYCKIKNTMKPIKL